MWYGCPERLSFSISYAYRMLPMLMEEFQNVLLSYRLRGNPPAHETFGGKVKYLIYQVKIIMQSFYPLMLNTASAPAPQWRPWSCGDTDMPPSIRR